MVAGELVGIVVGVRSRGEADRVVRLLTAEHGRVELLARGARASRKRFAGALEPGTRLTVQAARGRGPLPTLSEVEVTQRLRHAREDFDRIVYLSYGCELVDVLTGEGAAGSKPLKLLSAWLDLLEGVSAPSAASRVALEAKALTFAGLLPPLLRCGTCGEPLEGEVVFGSSQGGSHPWCGRGTTVDASVLAGIEALRRTPLADTPGAPWPTARWLLTDFVEYQVGRGLKAREMVALAERQGGERA